GEVQDNSFEDYLYETVSYFIKNDEPTLFFLPTKKETRKWAGWCCERIDAPRARNAIAELSRLEETRSRNELLYLLEKGIAYHNADLSWEERNIVETYLRKGEIKLILSTTTLAMGINLPFKNVILTVNKYTYDNADCKRGYLTSLTPTEAENMGGRAGRLNRKEKDSFGRVVFLAHSRLLESILLNLFFPTMKPFKLTGTPIINDPANPYNRFLQSDTASSFFPLKKELHFMNFLLREIGRGINRKEKLKKHIDTGESEDNRNEYYWKFYFEKNVFKRTDIGEYLKQLTEMGLVKMNVKDADVFVLTDAGMLVHSRELDIDTYFFYNKYLENQSGKMSDLEIITLLAKSDEGKNVSIPYPQFNQVNDRYNYGSWKYVYQEKMEKLVSDCGEEDKKIYEDILEQGTEKYRLNIDDYLSMKKALLLYDWIGDKEVKEIEEEYKIYGGAIQKIGESFSWLAECLAAVAESLGWDKEEKKKEKIIKIRILSERLAQGLQEEELKMARLHIPGLSRYYIKLLQREGYSDRECLEELSEEELSKVLPKRIAGRIKKRFLQDKKRNIKKDSYELPHVSVEVKMENCVAEEPSLLSSPAHPILEIDKRRPDRIIFEGKEIKVTAKEFSLIYLLAQNNNQVMIYDILLDELWKDEEDAIYNRVSFHI
ncbi:MAG: winged helix-turn-helix domain-containing protein, partial [Candidatus Atribacteria bacterium]|nr:winged helix-turn-helix domain-containing protein [Candidatus Atribacteria bacterium]